MARVTQVAHARQRYEQVPAKVDEQGNPVKVGLTRSDGSPKTDKRGRQIFITPMVDDRSKPLPMPKCDKCSVEIKPGDPYKHVTPKSGPYGGRRRVRCATCPAWAYWELSNSWSARIAEMQHHAQEVIDGAEFSEEADAQAVAEEVAGLIRELAEQKEEAADNLEEGFGHETSQSAEIRSEAESMSDWADEVEGVEIPDFPEAESTDCDECDGTGEIENPEWDAEGPDDQDAAERIGCDTCGGTGEVEGEEPSEDQVNDWAEEARQAIQDALDNCPL